MNHVRYLSIVSNLFDLSAHGRIRATGEDRARLLHALSTNHVQQLKPGEQVYAFFLTAQGRILADAHILCFEDSLLIDTEPETRELLFRHIDHYIIADDVTLEDETEVTFSFGVEGQGSEALVDPFREFTVAPITATGAGGYRVYGPVARKEEVWQQLIAAGAVPGDFKALRVEHFQPRYGEDITDKTLPQETGLTHALHFQKGCYLGQEIVERIHSRAHVNRMLRGLVFEGCAPAPQAKVLEGETEVGKITSSHGSSAIAMLRVSAGTGVSSEGVGALTRPVHGA